MHPRNDLVNTVRLSILLSIAAFVLAIVALGTAITANGQVPDSTLGNPVTWKADYYVQGNGRRIQRFIHPQDADVMAYADRQEGYLYGIFVQNGTDCLKYAPTYQNRAPVLEAVELACGPVHRYRNLIEAAIEEYERRRLQKQIKEEPRQELLLLRLK